VEDMQAREEAAEAADAGMLDAQAPNHGMLDGLDVEDPLIVDPCEEEAEKDRVLKDGWEKVMDIDRRLEAVKMAQQPLLEERAEMKESGAWNGISGAEAAGSVLPPTDPSAAKGVDPERHANEEIMNPEQKYMSENVIPDVANGTKATTLPDFADADAQPDPEEGAAPNASSAASPSEPDTNSSAASSPGDTASTTSAAPEDPADPAASSAGSSKSSIVETAIPVAAHRHETVWVENLRKEKEM